LLFSPKEGCRASANPLSSQSILDCKDINAIDKGIVKIPYIKRIEAVMRQVYSAWPGLRQYISTF